MDLIDDAPIFAAGAFAFVGAQGLIAFARHRRLNLGALALLASALSVSAIATAVADRTGSADAGTLAACALVPAFALAAHLGIEYGYAGAKRPVLALLYGAAVGLVGVGAWGSFPEATLRVVVLSLGGICASATAVAYGRSYTRGKKDALPVLAGSVALLFAIGNDLAFHLEWMPRRATLFGFVVFVFAEAATLLGRVSEIAEELVRSTRALRLKTRELRRSHGELRSTQQELVHKEQLAVVGELAAVIAHEVRNPLAIVANAVAGLKKDGLPREDQGTLLSILDEEVQRLNRLVTDLLGYARPLSLQRTQLAIDELVDRALSLARAKAGIVVQMDRGATVPRVWGDANHLRQVFENLVDNAVQAMHGTGTITVRMKSTTIEGMDGLAVDVVDTGEGMDTLVRKRAKDPFFTTRPSGTGLGLAIVDRIVDAHGGAFLIESRAGEGTTATVFLPFGRGGEPPVISSRGSRRPNTPRTPPDAPGAG